MQNQHFFEKIKLDLLRKIQSGEWPSNMKIPSSRKLSVQYQCSINTLERALKELQQEGFLTRLDRKGSFVSGRDSAKKSGLIAAIAISIENPDWISQALQCAEDELYNRGYSLMIANDAQNIQKLSGVVRTLIDRKVDGVMMFPMASHEEEVVVLVKSLMENGIKVVFLDRYLYGINIPYVITDNVRISYKLTKLLIRNGHRKIAFIRNSNSSNILERRSGFEQALFDSGIEFQPDMDVCLHPVREQLVYEKGMEENPETIAVIRNKVLDAGFSAVLFSNFVTLQLGTSIIKSLGCSFPEDISVATFDPDFLKGAFPDLLTGVIQPFGKMGRQAAKILADDIEGKLDRDLMGLVIPSQIVSGNSVKNI